MLRFVVAALALTSSAALAAPPPDSTAYHVMPLLPRPHAAAGTTVNYYAGPVLPSVKIAVVIWGSAVNAKTVHGITPFLTAMANSTYLDQLTQYSTNITGINGMPGTDQIIGRGNVLGQFKITPKNTATVLSDGAVRKELKGQIASGAVPAADLDTLYMIYFPSNVTITLGGSKSCVQFGGYHLATSASVTPSNIFYAVIPDCSQGFASQTIVSSHELAEAITDAIPTPGTHPAYPQAWNTANGFEIGDLCQGNLTTLRAGTKTWRI